MRSATRRVVQVSVVAAALLLPPAAAGHFSSGLYSHKRGDCASRVDPIGAVFYGPAPLGAPSFTDNLAVSANHISFHSGWGDPWGGTGQYFATHGYCAYWDGQLASAGNFSTRHHVRLRRTYHWDEALKYTTVGTPHYEVWTSCGHAVRYTSNGVSGYDIARQRLIDTVGAGHFHYVQAWGNTQRFTQCNGWVAQSNGNVRLFSIPSWWH